MHPYLWIVVFFLFYLFIVGGGGGVGKYKLLRDKCCNLLTTSAIWLIPKKRKNPAIYIDVYSEFIFLMNVYSKFYRRILHI